MRPADLSFDTATAVRPTEDPAIFQAAVHPLWSVGDKPNGGYLLALMGRAAREVARGEDPAEARHQWEVVSASITYVLPPALTAATVRTSLMRQGRTAAQVRAVLVQEGRDMVDAVFVLSTVPPSSASAPRYDGSGDLVVAEPDDCERLKPEIPGGTRVGIMDVLDLRLDPATNPFTGAARPDARAELRGWVRFADGRQPDPLSLLFSVDAVPPATLMIGSSGWVPTLQMTAFVRAVPRPGWLGLRFTAHLVSGGMVDETCVLWDASGRVVGQSTQLARLRFPDQNA